MNRKPDFIGVGTAYDVRCTDGRIIEDDSFGHQIGDILPLVHRHKRDEFEGNIGVVQLEHSEDPKGIKILGFFSDTPQGRRIKELVKSGTIRRLSIYATGLIEHGLRVVFGNIEEVSTVYGGANDKAVITSYLSHEDVYMDDDEFIIYSEYDISIPTIEHEGEGENEPPEPDGMVSDPNSPLYHKLSFNSLGFIESIGPVSESVTDDSGLEHYGTKGMKWGVQKDASKGDKKWGKQVYSKRTYIKAYNKVADHMNSVGLKKLNAKHKGKDLKKKENWKAYVDDYTKEYKKVAISAIDNIVGTTSPSGKYSATVTVNRDTGYMAIHPEGTTVQHEETPTLGDKLSGLNDDQLSLLIGILDYDNSEQDNKQPSERTDSNERQKVWDSLTEDQQTAFAIILDSENNSIIEQSDEDDDVQEQNVLIHEGETTTMTLINTLNQGTTQEPSAGQWTFGQALQHAQSNRISSVRSYLNQNRSQLNVPAGVLQHDVTGLDVVQPDYKNRYPAGPMWFSDDRTWVGRLLQSTKKLPFSKIDAQYVNLDISDAQAKGHIKGNIKNDATWEILNRTVDAHMIYIKQSLKRQDMLSITDFNMMMWMKAIMRENLEFGIGKGVLFGDGRSIGDLERIDPSRLIPVYGDDPVYTHPLSLSLGGDLTQQIDDIRIARKEYRGSGRPTAYVSSDWLARAMTRRDADKHRMHTHESDLAAALGVREIVEVPEMDNIQRVDGLNSFQLHMLIFNPADYSIGADKGGQNTMFDDFDIDYNLHKFLLETMISGMLTKPKSAISVEEALT